MGRVGRCPVFHRAERDCTVPACGLPCGCISMDAIMADLTPANENPWYVLATLYGEQEGEEIHDDLAMRNSMIWNAWACARLDENTKQKLVRKGVITSSDSTRWGRIEAEVKQRHELEMRNRNGAEFGYPGLPNSQNLIDMSSLRFSNPCSFQSFLFMSLVNFENSVFHSNATFEHTTFGAPAMFIGLQVWRNISFRFAHFDTDAFFIGSEVRGNALFQASGFAGSSFFDQVHFGNFESSVPVNTVFVGARFEQPVSFRQTMFCQSYPDFRGAVLHENTTFTARNGFWPERIDNQQNQNALEVARESAATIRHLVGKQGLPEDEHFFFRKEMGFARQIGPLWQRLPYIGFGALSDYGYSIARPFRWLACLFAYPLGFYGGYLAKDGAAIPAQITGALGLAFSSTFNFFGFQRTYFREELAEFDALMSFLSGSQTVMGYVLLFFLALGLRQRFRLR